MGNKVKIQIYRQKHYWGLAVHAIIKIDGNEVGTVRNGKTEEIIVGEGMHQLEVSFWGVPKNTCIANIDFKINKKTKDYDYIFDYVLGKMSLRHLVKPANAKATLKLRE